MQNQNWHPVQRPLFRWVHTIEKIICAHDLPSLSGSLVYVTSDYSGHHKSSRYEVISALYIDIENSVEWERRRRLVRDRYLQDGRRLSFKALNDSQRQKALIPFLGAADAIHGVSVTLAISKGLPALCIEENDLQRAYESLELGGEWTHRQLETALRIVHLISLLIAGLSRPNQNIYWISDEDELFANTQRTRDVQKIISKFTSHYVSHSMGELGIGTTTIDEGDRIEEDLAAIPDLIAGAVSEAATKVAEHAGGTIPYSLAVPIGGKLSPKTDLIISWVMQSRLRLRKVVIVFDMAQGDVYHVSQLSMLA